MKTLYLWDGSAFLYRSFFALPPLSTKEGFPTNAIYGFLRALLSMIKRERPLYFAVAFDLPKPTKRENLYLQYKAKRPQMPDPLKVQIPLIKELLKDLGISIYEVEGYEADDLIATLSWWALDRGFSVKVYSPDKDVLQLINDRLLVVNPISGEVFNRGRVKEKFGVPPERLKDYLALVGDKVDNIEGVRGIGPKRAIGVLEKYGSVANILESWEEFSKEFPSANRESIELAYELLSLHRVEELSIDEEGLKVKEPDLERLKQKLEKLDMKSILKEIDSLYTKPKQGSLF
ncbi:MAG: 5'-3' exonuclease [Acidobacteria bacterium]|jgi:DNA polymerase-1|nr:MAG: 5'-3' exonuclease [Acidobacteriota bacterium]